MIGNPDDKHIVRSFDSDLKALGDVIMRMGALAEAQIAKATEALLRRDPDLTRQVIDSDKTIDALEQQADAMTVRMLALRQPMARDLREIVATIKIASDIERIGDYAKNMAKRAAILSNFPALRPVASIARMANLAGQIVKQALDSYIGKDADLAQSTWRRDEEVDELYNSLFRELVAYMMEDQKNIGPATHLLFTAKNIERIGDHATNIAEIVYFIVTGKNLDESRPKADTTDVSLGN